MKGSSWDNAYARLESLFREQVEVDNSVYGCKSVYRPNILPKRPVDFILVGMEPSLARWAGTPEETQTKIARGFKDFAFSATDFLLHFCVRQYSCADGRTYHLTNLSKGVTKVRDAGSRRRERYERWYRLLQAELNVVAKSDARVVSVGKQVGAFVENRGLDRQAGAIIPPSNQAARYRGDVARTRAQEYQVFAATVTPTQIGEMAIEVLKNAGMDSFIDGTLERIRRSHFSDSKRKLAFTYKVKFEELRQSGRSTYNAFATVLSGVASHTRSTPL